MAHQVKVRQAGAEDVEEVASLIVRLKRLNGEFDPLLKVREDALENAKRYVANVIKEERELLLVGEERGKAVGLVNAVLRERLFYEPKLEGAILDFYILPEYRRTGLGRRMIEEAVKQMKQQGAEIVTAEFPSQNKIASSFYDKLGFRAITSVYAKYGKM